MKKIILTLAAAVALSASVISCGSKDSAAKAGSENVALGDSIATALGHFAGAQSAMGFGQARTQGDSARMAKMDKKDFLRGLKEVLFADTNKLAYYEGLSMGLQLVNPMMGLTNDAGIPVNREKIYAAFQEVFEKDTVTGMDQYYAEYSSLMRQAQQIMVKKQEESIANSPAAQANLKDGQAYADKMLKEGYTKAASGLVYKIEDPGTGPKVTDSDRVTVAYTGKLVNGTVFDQNENATFSPQGVVKGFGEALRMLGKGGKMIAVIPADLAYGLQAPASIGPNSTLVFNIEVKSIETPAAAK